MKKIDLEDIVEQMRNVADDLVPYTFPRNHPKYEQDISFLKTRYYTVDGYDLILYFSRADYEKYYQETLQLLSRTNSFLPFYLVSKIGRIFLGSHNLYLTEIFRNNKKLYLWTIWTDKDGKPSQIKHQRFVEECEFEGFNYRYVLPSQMNFH